jgi:type IX secretion system PorP/SprF family membrane protein
MKRLIFFWCAILLATLLKAQQIGDYTNYFYKPMLYNPAYTGVQKNISAMAITRIQWTGFTNAPQFNAFTLDGRVKKKRIGLGVNIISDKQGLTGRTGGDILYSYSLGLNKTTRLSFGISMGMINHTVNFAKAEVENTLPDPTLSAQTQSKTTLNGSAGIALIGKKIEAGFSIPQLIGNNFKYNSQAGTTETYNQPAQYLTYLRYKFFMNEEKAITLSPMALISITPHSPFQFDGGLIFDCKKKFSLATIYKSNSAIAVSAGFWVRNHFNVAYSYDFPLGGIATYSGQTHEILISYTFGKEEEPEKEEVDSTKGPKMKDLNTLLLEKLLVQVDSIFEKKDATKEDYRRLIESITEFSNSHFDNPGIRKIARDYTKKLLELEKGNSKEVVTSTVTVKGQLALTGDKSKSKPDFSNVNIELLDKNTGALIGVYTPKPRNGKYILILTPGEKYILKVEKEGYQTVSKEMSPLVKKESYEMKQALRLKKNKINKTKQKK